LTATEDRKLRQVMQETLQSVPPSPVPLEVIIRRGKGLRLRRAGAAVCGLALAGIVAVAALAQQGSPQPTNPATAPLGPAVPGGVIARGTAGGHPWRLAVQDIADPGYRCLPAIVLNGSDADPVYPDPGYGAAVALGPALPGIGFGFIQLPADISGIIINGDQDVPAVIVAACGYRYHVVGFAYSLSRAPRITVAHPPPGWPAVFVMPALSTKPPATAVTAQSAGMWINTGPVPGEAASGLLASGRISEQDWSIRVMFGTGGDCYEFSAPSSLGSAQMGSCGPVSTPNGPETIMALPIGFPYPDPSHPASGATGYAIQVCPATARLKALLSDGSSELAAPRVVDGRKYVAFIVPNPLQLSRLTWLDAAGRVIASTTALPRYGYLQFQP
jgi:hypothetical protein